MPLQGELVSYWCGREEKPSVIWAQTYLTPTPPTLDEWVDNPENVLQAFAKVSHKWPANHPVHKVCTAKLSFC